jgi:hypothetical protein
MDDLVQKARIEGNLDTGIVDLKANVIKLKGTPKVLIFVLNFLLPLIFICCSIENVRMKITFL